VGTPHTPAKDFVLCTPYVHAKMNGVSGDTPRPGKGLHPLHSFLPTAVRFVQILLKSIAKDFVFWTDVGDMI
jgi:hypothetical protein